MESVNEVVTRLYSIRAGMCVLASEKEKSDAIVAHAESVYDASLKEAENKLRNARAKLDDAETRLNDSEDDERYTKRERRGLFVNFLKFLFWSLLSLFLVALLLALAAATLYFLVFLVGGFITNLLKLDYGWMKIFEWYVKWLMTIPEGWVYALLFLVPLVGMGCTGGFGTLLYFWFIDEKIITDRLAEALADFLSSFTAVFKVGKMRKKSRRAGKSVENAKYIFKNAEKIYNDERQKIEAKLSEEMQRANVIIYNSMIFYSALAKLYGNFLNERDWKNVDYMIYSFETGRAESLKEALQLADREEQTQRIVETIQEATRRICETIKSNADRILDSLQRNFAMISDMVAEESAKINVKMDNMQIAQGVQTAYLANISSEVNIANEFMKHSDESSSKLANNMELLRADYRRVNSLC